MAEQILTFHRISKNKFAAKEESVKNPSGIYFNSYIDDDGIEQRTIFIGGVSWKCDVEDYDLPKIPNCPSTNIWYERTNRQTFSPTNENGIKNASDVKATRIGNRYDQWGTWSYSTGIAHVEGTRSGSTINPVFSLGTLKSICISIAENASASFEYSFKACPLLERIIIMADETASSTSRVQLNGLLMADCEMLTDFVFACDEITPIVPSILFPSDCTGDSSASYYRGEHVYPTFQRSYNSYTESDYPDLNFWISDSLYHLWSQPGSGANENETMIERFAREYPKVHVKKYSMGPSILDWPKYII